jgi:N-acetylmuramic acid 6-phosphate etherase
VTNRKLHDRALRILEDVADLNREEAAFLLERSGRNVKLALLMFWTGIEAAKGTQLLAEHHGHLRKAIEGYHASQMPDGLK